MEHKDNKVEEVLEELRNVLDSITKQSNLNNEILQKDNLKKIEDIKNILKSEQKEVENINQDVVDKKSNEENITLTSTEVKKEEIDNKILKKDVLDEKTTIEEKEKVTPEKRTSSVEQISQQTTTDNSKEKVLINTMFLFPSILQDAKDIFFSNINSTLKRVSKKNVEVVDTVCISYDSLAKDVLLQYALIIEKINKSNINVVILLVNENTFETEDFIKKISSFVLLAKSIDAKGLKLKSTYLDLSIDLLLNIK